MSPRFEFPHARRIEASFGHGLGNVEVAIGGAAARTAEEMDAAAFTSAEQVGFRDAPSLRLSAHEAAHVIQQRRGARPSGLIGSPGDTLERHADAIADAVVGGRDAAPMLDAVPSVSRPSSDVGTVYQLQRERSTFPWIGKISGTWSAALRETPKKSSEQPHANTEADLPRGAEVKVVGRRGGWLRVTAEIDGVPIEGYVSQELVKFVRASAFELGPIEIKVHIPSIAEALVLLKRAETRLVEPGSTYRPDEDEQAELGLAISVLERTGKYRVDPATFAVRFVETPGAKIEVESIEDFILFVEEVERRYPAARAREIASEVRQMYFADENWRLLVASRGLTEQGSAVDIETEPHAIAQKFDMGTLAPRAGRRFATRAGEVDIGHVMAGIDSVLSGFPPAFPGGGVVAKKKYDLLRTASGGDSRDFTTWAGDIGQAYAEFLVDRHVNENAAATLSGSMATWSDPAALRGDVHGYIAAQAWMDVPASVSPTGGDLKVSNILRDLYLVKAGSRRTYRETMATVASVPADHLEATILDRSRRFARVWFANRADDVSSRGNYMTIGGWMDEFDELDARADNTAELSRVVHEFVKTLSARPE